MLIKIKSGLRAGEIQNLAPTIAQSMIADGRAVLAFDDQYPTKAIHPPRSASAKAPKTR